MLSPFGDPLLGDSLFDRMQRIADNIKRDVEYQLSRSFDTFRVLEHRALEDPNNYSSYFMKIKTDDNGHVRVKTIQKEPNSDWKVNVEEYDRGNPAIGQDENKKKTAIEQEKKRENTSLTSTQDDKNKLQTTYPSFFGDSLFERMQWIADSVKRDVENRLNRTFNTFKVLEHKALEDPDQNASYYMKIKTDDNGHVRVKTMQKEPNSDWKVNVEEYDRGNAAIGQSERKSNAALDQGDRKSIGQGERKENTSMDLENKNQTQTANP